MMVINRIAAVSYLNTVPFVYGINHADNLRGELLLAPPSQCAVNFKEGKADIALVPAGALPMLGDDAQVVTSFCIGAEGSVRTVVIVSDTPIGQAKNLWLDSHSMTSVVLARILCKELWKINPALHTLDDYSVLDNPSPGDAFVLIGDKVFEHEGQFKHSYDLADAWREMTGLPFVFAVWVARKGVVTQETIDDLEDALTLGVERIWEALEESGRPDPIEAYEYLTKNIDFLLDNPKRKALELYLQKARRLVPHADPG